MRKTIWIYLAAFALVAGFGTIAAADDAVGLGHDLYNTVCARCHGEDMTDPESPAPDLHKFPKSAHADFVATVENGKDQMPPWKGVLSPEQIEQIWAYVRSGGN